MTTSRVLEFEISRASDALTSFDVKAMPASQLANLNTPSRPQGNSVFFTTVRSVQE